MAKDRIPVPTREVQEGFACAIAEKPTRLARLLDLLRTAPQVNSAVHDIALDLAETTVRVLGLPVERFSAGECVFEEAVRRWISTIPHRPLKMTDLEVVVIVIHIGTGRAWLGEESAYSLIRSALYQERKEPPARSRDAQGGSNALEVLLSAPPSSAVLSALVELHAALRREAEHLRAELEGNAEQTDDLEHHLEISRTTEQKLRGMIRALEIERDSLEARREELEGEMVALDDAYKHKLSDLRGRIRGMLDGQLSRWIETALDASRSEPPWLDAVQERLEDALALIEREKQWLRPLG